MITNGSTQDLVVPTFLANDAATTVAAAGTSIDLKFSEDLAAVANNQAEFDQFTVKVNGVANAVTATALTNDVLTLTLTNKIGSGDVVTVEYAQDSGSGSEITDADATNANPLSDFTATLITNGSTQDLVVPTFLANDGATTVAAAGTSIDLKFSENLAAVANNQAEFDQFTVKVNGVANAVTATALTNDVLTLTLTNEIGFGDVVSVEYAQASGSEITDADATNANPLSDFTATLITNGSTQNLDAPTLLANDAMTYVVANGGFIYLKFSENLAAVANNQAEHDQFTIKVNGVANAVTATTLTDDILVLTLTNKIGSGDLVTVEYAQAVGSEIKDAAATNANLLSDFPATFITNSSTQDRLAPSFLANDAETTVSAAGTSIDLKFSENLAAVANNQDEFNQFTVKVNGVNNAVTATALTDDILTLTLTNKIGSGDIVTVEYAQASGSEITDADATYANPLSNFTATLITNGSTQDIVAPDFMLYNYDDLDQAGKDAAPQGSNGLCAANGWSRIYR